MRQPLTTFAGRPVLRPLNALLGVFKMLMRRAILDLSSQDQR
jgi:hypothetical protein